ncbi:MAG TPA: imidazole glycerol phosphate synthase subunit HisH [Oculatellaceae cyanobacterium]
MSDEPKQPMNATAATSDAAKHVQQAIPAVDGSSVRHAVELVDVGGGNIGSVIRFLERLNVPFRHARKASELTGTVPLILPGVGSFGAVMQHLRTNGLAEPVVELVRKGTPFLGVCVGMQILFEGSEESPNDPGLALLKGRVVKFTKGKVPQIGWNLITPRPSVHSLFPNEEFVYFVNSYFARPEDDSVVSFTAEYEETFCAAVHTKNITAFQFHPEKSGKAGERLISAWLKEVGVK